MWSCFLLQAPRTEWPGDRANLYMTPSMVSEVPSVDLYERMLEESRKKAKNLEDKFAQLMKDKGVSTYCTPLSRN